ncbi:MAG: chemotaxis protein CheW [Legionella sp.]|nr:chemotaxis protein CheW [Legionella sp.]
MQFEKIIKQFQFEPSALADEKQTFIQFAMCGSHYALDIHYVSEIVEVPVITPYPEIVSGYLGIVNLGGQIIPVIDFTGKYTNGIETYVIQNTHLLLVTDFSGNSSFGLIIERPRRVEVAKKMLLSATANINDLPVRLLSESDFHFKEIE